MRTRLAQTTESLVLWGRVLLVHVFILPLSLHQEKNNDTGGICNLLSEGLILPTTRALLSYFLGLKLVFSPTKKHPHTLSKAFRNGNKASPQR